MIYHRLVQFLVIAILAVVALGRKKPPKLPALSDGSIAELWVMKKIHDNDVMVFAKSTCPHCKGAKYSLDTYLPELPFDVKYEFINIDKLPKNDAQLIQDELEALTNQRLVPSIFINHVHIGGNSDLQTHLQQGSIRASLEYSVQVREEKQNDLSLADL